MSRAKANERFSSAVSLLGLEPDITRFPEDTRTAAQAAAALRCELGQIIKSLIFVSGEEAVLALTAGDRQVNTQVLADLTGGKIEKADAETVRRATGFAIGGVPPFGHSSRLLCFIDPSIYRYEVAWGAAGTPDTVFSLPTDQLAVLSGGQIREFSE